MRVKGEGPIPTRIMLVGEAPGEQEEASGQPFVGAAGHELNRMLHEVDLMRSECYTTNVCKVRPPNNYLPHFVPTRKKDITEAHTLLRDKWVTKEVVEGYEELLAEIAMVQPNIIVTFGNLAMWALTGKWGIMKWRGSLLQLTALNGSLLAPINSSPAGNTEAGHPIKVIPTIHPAAIFRDWSSRALVLNDLRRVKRHMTSRLYENKPEWKFQVRPSFNATMACILRLLNRANDLAADTANSNVNVVFLNEWKGWLDFDIETRYGHIDCIGFSWSKTEGICIPFIARGSPEGYWPEDQEAEIVFHLYKLLTHPNIKIRWQNGLYDAQYVYRHWHFIIQNGQDTMISQHSTFCALPKGLSFLASMYADWYVYWKDEGKIASDAPEEQRWAYNLQDCVYTREVGEVLTETLEIMKLSEVDATQQALFHPVLNAMLRGVAIDPKAKEEMAVAIQEEISHRQAFLFEILGHEINPRSPKQMNALFYTDLKQPPVYNRTMKNGRMTSSPTCDDEALLVLAAREPLIKPICHAIADLRTLKKFYGDFVMMALDEDGRMRCSFNIAGDAGGKSAPYSYRLSSSKNAFGTGGNLQTIPSEKSSSVGKAAARGSMDFKLPNIRSMYVPDPGFTFFDMDLDRADLQVVVRESGEEDWMDSIDAGVDMHLLNAYILDRKEPPPQDELVETHPNYWKHREPYTLKRGFARIFCHATNYGGSAKGLAPKIGWTVHAVDQAQKHWFSAHPGIKAWHTRTLDQINRFRFVENRWGYKWFIFGRLELPEALAWGPQSTVGILINKIWIRFAEQLPEVQVLIQVHDSLDGQIPTHRVEALLPQMKELSHIEIPYERPLTIPTHINTSTKSWGDC